MHKHIFMIEKGRHRKINLANRICPLCRSEVEDEFHFSISLKDICDKFFLCIKSPQSKYFIKYYYIKYFSL